MKKLVLKLDVNDEQVLNTALGRIARISGNYKINMNKSTKLCTVTGDNIDPIQIVGELRMLCDVDIVAVEPPEEPEKKKEDLVEEVVNAPSLAAAVGPSKEPEKEDELRKEEPTKREELVEEVVNASSRAAAVGPSKEPEKEEELRKEEPRKHEELVEEVVNASSRAAAVGPSKEPKKEEEPKKQEEKRKGEELLTDVKEDPNKTFRAPQMTKAVFKLDLHDAKAKTKAMKTVSGFPGVDSISMDFKDKKMTVIGDIDPVHIVAKLRKLCHTEIITVGPAKEPAKKKEPGEHEDRVAELVEAYKSYNPPPYYYARRAEEDPNACVIN